MLSHSCTPTDLLHRLSDRLENTTPMRDYMIRGNDVESEEPTVWEGTPFTPTVKLESKGNDTLNEYVRKGATRVYEELQRHGELDEVRTGWFEIKPTAYRGSTKPTFYRLEVGPVVAAADDVEWTSAFQMDLETAPAFKSEEWKAVASEFQLSERAEKDCIPSVITCAYSALEKHTKRNDGVRSMHPYELRNHTPAVKDRHFDRAMDLLATFPGVDGPADGAPVWELIDGSTARSGTSEGAEGESHA